MPDPKSAELAGEADDLGAALSDAWDNQEATETATAPTGEVDPPASPPADEGQPASSSAGAGGDAARARDAAGRFTKAEQAAMAAAGQQPSGEFKVPEKWPADVRAELEAMHKANPAHAEFVLKQYAHFRGEAARHIQYHAQQESKRVEKLAQTQKQVEDLLAPGRQQRALKGIDDTSYIRNLVAAGDFLDKHPVEGLKHLAKQYGVDLSNLDATAGGAPAIQPELAQVMERQARIEAALQQQYVGMEQGRLHQASGWIDQFAAQTDTTGQPLFPHFDEVLPEIIVNVQYQMQSGQQVDVKAAYDRAIRMNDQVWLKEQRRTSESARKADEAKHRREIEDAKKAGFSVSGSGSRSMDAVPDDIGEHLSRVYDQQS